MIVEISEGGLLGSDGIYAIASAKEGRLLASTWSLEEKSQLIFEEIWETIL